MQEAQYESLINRFLAGEATERESQELKAWLQASPEHEQVFAEAEALWQNTTAPEPAYVPAFEDFWQKIEARLDEEEAPAHARVIRLNRQTAGQIKAWVFDDKRKLRWMAAAAVLLIMIGSAALYENLVNGNALQTCSTQNAQRLRVLLPDGSQVELNAVSEIKFSKSFADSIRLVMFSGHGYFEVTPDRRPFIVQTENAQVRVLGTKFDLKSRRRKTQLVVEEGVVALRSAAAAAESSVILRGNEMSLCLDYLPPQNPERVNAAHWLGWLRNKFVFEKMPLQEAVEELQRFYDFEIRLADPELGKLTITGEFEQEPLEEILSVICRALNLKYRHDGRMYFISG